MNPPTSTPDSKLIAFFHQSADLYGSDRVLLDLVLGVEKAGCKAVVLLPSQGPLTAEFEKHGIEFHVLPVVKLSRARFSPTGLLGLAREARTSLCLYDRVFQGRPVHLVHSNTIAVLGGAIWAKRRSIRHVWHVHEIIIHPKVAAWGFPRLVSALSDQVICNSHATRTWLANVVPRLANRMQVIWNGVEAPTSVDAQAVASLREKFHPGGARVAIGLIGRINRLKGHNLLMDAAEMLHRQGRTDFSLVFVGSPPPGQETYLEQLQSRIAASPLRERIVLQGFTPDVWPTYAALDMVCVPSTEPESFGLVAAEAMAIGKLVLASRIGALAEIVNHGTTGETFFPITSNSLCNSISELLVNKAYRESLGENAKQYVKDKLSTKIMVETYVSNFT